jgi:hypothetical protein
MLVFASNNNRQSQQFREGDILMRLELFKESQQQDQAQPSESIFLKQRPELSEDEQRKNLAMKEAIELSVVQNGRFAGKSVAQVAQIMAEERDRRQAAVQREIEKRRAQKPKITPSEKSDLN